MSQSYVVGSLLRPSFFCTCTHAILYHAVFVSVSIIAMAVLFPIDIIYNVRYVTSSNIFSMLTIQAISGNWLYGHVVVAYVITLIVFYFIWTNYAEMVRLRWQYFRSDEYQGSLHARSLLVSRPSSASCSCVNE